MCLRDRNNGLPIPYEIPTNSAASPWSSPTIGDTTAFPELPAVAKSNDIWKLSSKASPLAAPPTPQTIHLPAPIRVQYYTASKTASPKESSLHRRTGLRGAELTAIPMEYIDVADSIQYDETTIITRFLWVLGLKPGTLLADDDLNRLSTIGEHHHVVRMIGTLSEHPQGCSQMTYSNGLTLDLEFSTKNFFYIYDSRRGGTFLKLMEPAIFGTSQAAAATLSASTFPMVQRIPSAMPVYDAIHQIYTIQAVTEACAEAFFNSATTLAGVRGVPHGLQCHAITAACIVGTTEVVKKSILGSGLMDPSNYKDTTFMTLLNSTRHYVRPESKDTAFPKFIKYTDKNGYPITPLSRKDLPKGIIEIEDIGIEIIWLQDTCGSLGVVFQELRNAFKADPVKSFFVCGIPLEMAISPTDFKNHSQHLQATSAQLNITIVCNVRSCLPVRDVIAQLHHHSGNSHEPHKFLIGACLLHAAQATDGTVRPWSMLFIWNAISPSLDLFALRSLAEPGSILQFHGTNCQAALAVLGCLQFIRLDQAGKPRSTHKGTKTRA